jgi:hypothetical protein
MTEKKPAKKAKKQSRQPVKLQDAKPAVLEEQKIDDLIKDLRKKDDLLNIRKTLLKKEEWGMLTFLSLLLASVFPAYFVNILLISFFTELGHFWTTHLTEVGRQRLMEFEKEFRVGYDLEKEGRIKEAIKVYEALVPKYSEHPKISGIASRRMQELKKKGA